MGRADLFNVHLTGNKANTGGAIWNRGTLNATGCTFDLNSATGTGGAINTDAVSTITDCLFSGNQAASGGAIEAAQTLTVSGSRFTANAVSYNGGALRTLGTCTLTATTFDANTAANDGGGIMSHGTTALTNCTLAGNAGNLGGAMYCFEGTATLRHVTAASNTAAFFGGGLQINTAQVTATNVLLAGNMAPTNANLGGSLQPASANNLLDLTAAAARLGPLAGNGGGVMTLALLDGSPALDAAMTVAGLTLDQRGTARPQGAMPDIGAFERVPTVAGLPQFAQAGGTFDGSALVTLSPSSLGASIRYTTDGTMPTATSGTLYTGPFMLVESATVRAVSFAPGYTTSPAAVAFFVVRNGLETWRAQLALPADGSEDLVLPAGGKFAFGARTGGAFERAVIDDVRIETR